MEVIELWKNMGTVMRQLLLGVFIGVFLMLAAELCFASTSQQSEFQEEFSIIDLNP